MQYLSTSNNHSEEFPQWDDAWSGYSQLPHKGMAGKHTRIAVIPASPDNTSSCSNYISQLNWLSWDETPHISEPQLPTFRPIISKMPRISSSPTTALRNANTSYGFLLKGNIMGTHSIPSGKVDKTTPSLKHLWVYLKTGLSHNWAITM